MTRTLYESIGGEPTVRALVERFYDLMDTLPEAAGIRALHPETLDESREKLFMFLSGWMGGPPLYIERFGHPRLRARHLPFPIGEPERDQWLTCMNKALEENVRDPLMRQQLLRSLAQLADFMRNKEDRPPA
ncbi:MAG: group II truncated hemoglobin [Acidobacteria bacterium]|nr:group II truncated hemoglobin [Acidobacteriota bacterium]